MRLRGGGGGCGQPRHRRSEDSLGTSGHRRFLGGAAELAVLFASPLNSLRPGRGLLLQAPQPCAALCGPLLHPSLSVPPHRTARPPPPPSVQVKARFGGHYDSAPLGHDTGVVVCTPENAHSMWALGAWGVERGARMYVQRALRSAGLRLCPRVGVQPSPVCLLCWPSPCRSSRRAVPRAFSLTHMIRPRFHSTPRVTAQPQPAAGCRRGPGSRVPHSSGGRGEGGCLPGENSPAGLAGRRENTHPCVCANARPPTRPRP